MNPHLQPPESEEPCSLPSHTHEYGIRPAQPTDMERLVELLLSLQDHLEASNPEVWRMEPQARTQFRGQVASRLRAPDTCSLVAEHERDGVVGVIFGRIIVNKRYSPPRTGMVDQVFVAENHRRAGVGSRLVAELCCFFGQRGINDLSLRYVTGNQEAAGFWADLGFVPRITIVGASRQVVAKCLAQTHCT